MSFVEVPAGLEAHRRWGADWATWLDLLPERAARVCAEWELRPDGVAQHGHSALVLPVRTATGAPAALKLGFEGDEDAALEHLALTRWGGTGVVELLRADPHRRALLLERCEPRDLSELWDVEACELIAARYSALHVAASPPFDRLSDRLRRWMPALESLLHGAPVPRRMVEHALSLARAFVTDEATDGVLVHFDLHYANVLGSRRSAGEEWLVIDPKPLSGDPHVEVAPLLVNRFAELAGDVRRGVRRRFEAAIDAAMLEEDRARDWVIVRMLLNVSWTVQDLGMRSPDATDRDWITRCLSVAKAVQ